MSLIYFKLFQIRLRMVVLEYSRTILTEYFPFESSLKNNFAHAHWCISSSSDEEAEDLLWAIAFGPQIACLLLSNPLTLVCYWWKQPRERQGYRLGVHDQIGLLESSNRDCLQEVQCTPSGSNDEVQKKGCLILLRVLSLHTRRGRDQLGTVYHRSRAS